jgi:hypothetical protein
LRVDQRPQSGELGMQRRRQLGQGRTRLWLASGARSGAPAAPLVHRKPQNENPPKFR